MFIIVLGDLMNKNDLRYIKTETAIKDSFRKCVEKNGFEKTSVSMICETGLISRNAFYLHFTDKYDLLERLFDEFNASVSKSYDSEIVNSIVKKDVFAATHNYLNALIENRDDFLFLLTCSRERMEKLIQETIIEKPIKMVVPDFSERKKDIKINLNIRYMFSAMVAYTELWFRNFDDISREDAIYELYTLCKTPTLIFLDYFDIK